MFDVMAFSPILDASGDILNHLKTKKHSSDPPETITSNDTFTLGLYSSVGIATELRAGRSRHRILPIPVAERCKARFCGRFLAGIAGSNPAGTWMFALCVLYSKDKKVQPGLRSSTEVLRKKNSR